MFEGLKKDFADFKRKREYKKWRKRETPAFYYDEKISEIETAERAGLSYVGYCLGLSALAGLGYTCVCIATKGYMDELDANMFKNAVLAGTPIWGSGIPIGIYNKHRIYTKRDEYMKQYYKSFDDEWARKNNEKNSLEKDR